MALANYEHDLMSFVATSIGSLTLGTNCFAGPVRSPPEGADQLNVSCVTTGGTLPVELLEGGTRHLHTPTLMITVRSNPDAYEAGRNLAEEVYETVHNGAVSGYQWVRCLQGSPVYAGQSPNKNHYFTINLEMARLEH